MKKIIYLVLVGLIIIIASCEKILMNPNPETTNTTIFNEYVTLVKEKYAMLEFKGVDIQHLEDSIRAIVNNNMTETELFEQLSIISLRLRDGHSKLEDDKNRKGAYYDNKSGYPLGFQVDILADNYTGKSVNPDLQILDELQALYGFLPQDNEIAYLWVPSWNVEISDDEIEQIFASFSNAKGLIFDMRQNGGGDPSLATKFASYLTDKPVYTGFERFKTGPGANDFSDSHVTMQPTSSSNKFLKPVMVLTDRFCYSASTTFAYSVNPLDNVTFVGQRTGGGSGSTADGFLANGWRWQLSTSEFIDHLGNHLDDGFDPDIPVTLDTLITTQDEVIERAILELQ
ncbi:MAG: S41 family peptidase [Bacteroidetes bacterium]|jgi:hypothetical protein|nr:S41 family peptidase [Bacteroidota bacterium]MBT6686823.1 S41 family peptidase [Bacteroidota bacterium]MBT7144152.1 S41 family peptidase [Bacteroidota bacterium]MBT7491871.1 S41 family peptidase [Bacteroidota bacterium]